MCKNRKTKLSSSQKKFTFPKRSGGTITNILTVGIIVVLIGAGVMWLMKQAGETTQEYAQGMVNTSNRASSIVCTHNMGQIFQILQMYSMTEDELPASYEDLVGEVGDSRVFQCTEPNCPHYAYIPGQTLSSPPDNILLYEPAAAHSDKCMVLRVSGKVEALSPEEVQVAIQQTIEHLRR